MTASTGQEARLTIRDLRKSYGETVAVDGIELTVKGGEIFGMIGPDGAGKTSTMRIVCGLLLPDSGETRVMGFDPVGQHRSVRERIGYMPQRFSLYPDLTVEENLRFFADLYGVSKQEYVERVPKLMEFSRLGKFQNRRAGALSGGMKQKLALICTLIHTPEVLILDEPTFGVDPVSRKEFWNILRGLANDGLALLVSTAYMDEAGLCDRLALMHRGSIVSQGSIEEVVASYPKKLVTVRSSDISRMRKELISKLPESVEVHRFGDELHVVYETEMEENAVEQAVRESDGQIAQATPTIEDVFVALAAEDEVAA